MSGALHTPEAGIDMCLRIGQRVRHLDYKGKRVTGLIDGMSIQDGRLALDLALDEPIVINREGERPINLYRQHVPAHEVSPFDERDEQLAELLALARRLEPWLADQEQREKVSGDRQHDSQFLLDLRAAIAKATGSAA